ncbi:hypothetical protein [Mycolicibacterium brisbanense]|uniref:Uncharacterized protein n=1 Tax=Mycolicibacterium brisbanense TaxID=146020 RepID=A0A117I4P3_9MYCO|nr:hypothetical protein [Mycolicibacterium brisbanense]MCV7162278.1 hypothetical protein [Mycolicibacterium brisbanense]GAS87273.1 uncharacterized protein RMCB_1369 [Mycolicibacterium brisbanense]
MVTGVIARMAAMAALVTLLVTACQGAPPDRRADVTRLADILGRMPGVHAVSSRVTNRPAQGWVSFTITVEPAPGITAVQLAAVTDRYLQDLQLVDYSGYRSELDVTTGWNRFAVDAGELPIINDQQIIAQARDWVALREQFPTATIRLRATITHPGNQSPIRDAGHANIATIQLPDDADYTDAAAAAATLADRFPQLAGLTWTISTGSQHPADIKTTRRYPSAAELDVWRRINAEQTIPHTSQLTVNGRVSAPVWIAVQTRSHDPADAAALARQQLPQLRALPAPVLYTSSDQIQGHINGDGRATGPIAITVGGCTDRDTLVYHSPPAEQALRTTYETCPHPAP